MKKIVVNLNEKFWTLQTQICNYWLRTGTIIATVSGNLSDIKKGCLNYNDSNLQFYVFRIDDFYIVRIIKGYDGRLTV